jgi:hypothetical protein
MPFQDLRELLSPKTLPLPIGGIIYTIEQCTAEDWLWMHERGDELAALIGIGNKPTGDVQFTPADEFYKRALGPVFGKMVADEVAGRELSIAAYTAFFWHLGSEELAEQVWVNAGKATEMSQGEVSKLFEAVTQNRAQRRAKPATPRATSVSRKAPTTRASSARTGVAPRGTKSSTSGR